MKQPVLGDLFEVYPDVAGFKRTDTSIQAAQSVNVTHLRGEVLRMLRVFGALTADEIAERLEIDKLSIRPRLSELRLLREVYDTRQRRKNQSGHGAIVWGLVP